MYLQSMDSDELRKAVVTMSQKITQLEMRVRVLETKYFSELEYRFFEHNPFAEEWSNKDALEDIDSEVNCLMREFYRNPNN